MHRSGQERTKRRASSAGKRVSPQSLMRGEFVPMSKARELLGGADWRSLREWIAELGIKTYAHPTDGRTVLLRSTDVAKIAKISDRPFQNPARGTVRQSSRAVLERQLAELRLQHELAVDAYERQLADLREQHEREVEALRRRIAELEPPGSS